MSAAWELDLPDGWSYKSLIDLVSDIVDNRGRTAPTSSSGIPLIATNCITHDSLYPVFKNVRYVSQDTYQTWFRAHPRPGDIIFVNKGTPGLVCQVPDPVDFCFAQDMVALRPDSEVVDGEFLLAALRSVFVSEQVRAFSVGTTIPHLKKSDFSQLLIPVPPRHVQEYIGHIYCNLSRKIEVNRRINRKLEWMAQALYKHWFVDFGPFQDGEFVPSELGLVPEGWEVARLGDVAELTSGRSYKSSELSESSVALVTLKSFMRGGGYKRDGLKPYTGPFKDTQVIQPGEVIVACTDITQSADVIGRPALVQADNLYGTLVASLDCLIVRPKLDAMTSAYVYLLLSTSDFKAYSYAHSNGSTVLHLQKAAVPEFQFVCPPKQFMGRVGQTASRVFQEIAARELENVQLTAIRDYLLPRLLAGEVEV